MLKKLQTKIKPSYTMYGHTTYEQNVWNFKGNGRLNCMGKNQLKNNCTRVKKRSKFVNFWYPSKAEEKITNFVCTMLHKFMSENRSGSVGLSVSIVHRMQNDNTSGTAVILVQAFAFRLVEHNGMLFLSTQTKMARVQYDTSQKIT